jgi:HEAT repeat protein
MSTVGRKLSLASVTLLGILLLLSLCLRQREPVYQGKSVSHWMDQLQQPGSMRQAGVAIREIGPQAAPWLVNRIRAEHSGRRRIVQDILAKLPAQVRIRLRPANRFDELPLWNAIAAFGADARMAEPQLLKLLDCRNPPTRTDAAFALWRITADPKYLELLLRTLPKSDLVYRLSWDGAAAVSRLERALAASNASVREIAARGLAFIGDRAGPAAPDLAKLLNDPDHHVRLATISALRQIGPNRRQAVLGLIRALKDPANDDEILEGAAEILGMICAEAGSAEPDLLALVDDVNRRASTREQAAAALWRVSGRTNGLHFLLAELERCKANWGHEPPGKLDSKALKEQAPEACTTAVRVLNRLRDMGPSAKLAAPALLDLIQHPGFASASEPRRAKVLNDVIDAIAALEADPDTEVPAMAQLLRDSNLDVRLKAAIELVRLGPKAGPAVPELTSVLHDSDDATSGSSTAHYLTLCAAEALGKIGPVARTAAPELEDLLLNTNAEVRLEAAIALWRIKDPTNLLARALREFEWASDRKAQTRLVEVFGEMGPAANEAVPVVLRRMTYLPGPVRQALQKIDPEALARLAPGL